MANVSCVLLTPLSCGAPALRIASASGRSVSVKNRSECSSHRSGADDVARVPAGWPSDASGSRRPLGLLIPVELLEGRVSAYLMVSACFRRLLERGLGQERR